MEIREKRRLYEWINAELFIMNSIDMNTKSKLTITRYADHIQALVKSLPSEEKDILLTLAWSSLRGDKYR